MYLSDVPLVPLDPRIQSVIDAGVPGVQQTAYTPQTISVRLPSFDTPTLTMKEKLAIGGAVLLFILAGRR